MLRLKAGSKGAMAGWQFRIPSAPVYKSITFEIDANAAVRVPATAIAMQNFDTYGCSRPGGWIHECFNRRQAIGNSSGSRQWYSTRGSGTANRDGGYARAALRVLSGRVDVYRVRAVVKYQVLRQ